MTDTDPVQNIESTRHDPLLRLDQFIYRQDQMIRRLEALLKVGRVIGFELGLLIMIGLLHLIWAVWR